MRSQILNLAPLRGGQLRTDLAPSHLQTAGHLTRQWLHQAGERVSVGQVNHYLTDNEVAVAELN